ncbi:MAG TPA: hypothetical protein VLW50_20095 [Streptosporangiaceae bacterium]|nr:hypothetical protein [Streptosporangiaceae bacterium]
MGASASPRRVASLVASRLGTDVTRRFGSMLVGGLGHVFHDEPGLHEPHRIILLDYAG